MPAGYGVGDHQLFVINFLGSSLIGDAPKKIVRPKARRLNCNLSKMVRKYTGRLENLILQHRLIERSGEIYSGCLDQVTAKRKLERIDEETKQYMRHAEKKCRRIKSGHIPFSPEAANWIRQLQVYRSLLWVLTGGRGNRGNLCRAAYQVGIMHPFALSVTEVEARMKVCQEHCSFFLTHGQHFRTKHLRDRVAKAREAGNVEAANEIVGIMKREREQSFWRILKYVMKKQTGGSIRMVQVKDDRGEIVEFTTQEEVHEAIWSNIHR